MAAKGSILTADFKWFPVLQFYKVRIPEKVPGKDAFYYINHSNSDFFLEFELQQFTIPNQNKIGKSYIPQKKAS